MKIIFYKFCFLLIFLFATLNLQAEIVKNVEISGNERIGDETILVYGEINKDKDYSQDDINDLIKKLYGTNFFSKISVTLSNGILKITVEENPIINTIVLQGEKTKKFSKAILDIISLYLIVWNLSTNLFFF